MVKMEDDAFFNETRDDHIGNININNISSHYDKIEVNVLIQSVETNDCGTPIENSTYETTNSE